MTEIRTQLAAFRPPSTAGTPPATAGSFAEVLQGARAPDLTTYGNGRIPETALRRVGDTGHRLAAPAATSLEALMRAAREQGVTIGITDSYRSYAEQVDLA